MGGLRSAVAIGVLIGAVPAFAQTPTFAKDVAPIFYSKCVECHRPTMFAPMSLVSYEDARPWARSIRTRVAARTMPPWGADPAHGVFKNDPRLTDKQIETILAWVDAGAPKGDEKDLPPVPQFPDENDVYMPVSACPFRSSDGVRTNRNARMVQAFARLRPGATRQEALGDLGMAAANMQRAYPENYPASAGFTATAVGLGSFGRNGST